MSNHLDIGTIQAFLDRELDQEVSSQVSSHVAACDSCASLLAQSEDESAVVFPALAREFDTLVPTQRLWTKINDALETERRDAPFWQKAWAYARLSLVSPSIAVAAGLILVVGIAVMFWMNRTVPVTNTPDIAKIASPPVVPAGSNDLAPSQPEPRQPVVQQPRFERASFRPEERRVTTRPSASDPTVPTNTTNSSADLMPGEDSYVKTIASLSKSVDEKKDLVLRPSQRIAYERDMAVVNDSIDKMRQEVKRNPKNQSARQVLYTSYQNKIDLLNSVSQKEELMASVR